MAQTVGWIGDFEPFYRPLISPLTGHIYGMAALPDTLQTLQFPRSFVVRLSTRIELYLFLFLLLPFAVQAQEARQNTLPAVTPPPSAVADSEIRCAGSIEDGVISTALEIIGGEEEERQRTFAEGDVVYIRGGSNRGIKEGQEFSIIRPRGRLKSNLSRKKGSLGVFVQEIGVLRINKVRAETSTATISYNCDMVQFGDLLRAVPARLSLKDGQQSNLETLDRPSGKQVGRVVMAKDGREYLTTNHIVYIDLGLEDGLKAGSQLTIFRPHGLGNIVRSKSSEMETARNNSSAYETDEFQGGRYSNQANRVRNPEGSADQRTVKTPDIKENRPAVPRKVLGEMVVLRVNERTATAIITQVAHEVHTGDFVELQ
jgi:hypothetical protein